MATPNPAIVIVPGAWHTPDHYTPLTTLLRPTHETITVRHPSVSVSRDPGKMLAKDATVTADVMRKLLNDEGKDVVLVMHSYGGISGCEAVALAVRWLGERGQRGHGRVRRMVFLAAHVLGKGEAMVEGERGIPGIEMREGGMMVHGYPYERYYADTTREKAQPALDMLSPMAYSALTTPTSHAGWKDYGIPCTYIKCLKDKAVTSQHWETYIPRLRDAGVDLTVEELDSGHSPFWTDPEELAELLVRVVG